MALAGLGGAVVGSQAAIDVVQQPAPTAFGPERIRQGAVLAAVGNCIGCHTVSDGMPFAGGTPIETPFGTIYGTNITPDREFGIGAWSEAAFHRALREGVSRDGHLLYPAFPYDHFTALTDDDIGALYAYAMTRTPAHVMSRAHALRFPFGFRPLLAGWNLLYLKKGPHPPASADADARGAYLIEGLGHCGACHSPRKALGAEDRSRALAGGSAEGWYAPPLETHSPSPLPWDVDHLVAYLRTGVADGHALAGGPMQGVVAELAHASPDDVRAIAVRIVAIMGPVTPERQARAAAATASAASAAAAPVLATSGASDAELAAGAALYAGACGSCHELGRTASSAGALRLSLAVAVHDDDPRSLIRIIRDGIVPHDDEAGRWMPAFGSSLDDAQLTALLAYLRHAAAGLPPWPDLARHVKESRR